MEKRLKTRRTVRRIKCAIKYSFTGAIRLFYVALHGNPIAAMKVKITPGGYYEPHWATTAYGWQFAVEGYRDHQTGEEIYFFYKNHARMPPSLIGRMPPNSLGGGCHFAGE
ncbi:hypothetical protein [Fervidicola ferrireducens]|uniref:hypothetical protein n=1 Tax=Fervidicola ferrireducens TaxID=520764 RepID=UPI000833D857|nr:hypothetical protein [Fervidicola ferrireducens]